MTDKADKQPLLDSLAATLRGLDLAIRQVKGHGMGDFVLDDEIEPEAEEEVHMTYEEYQAIQEVEAEDRDALDDVSVDEAKEQLKKRGL